jgi:hypothetical protein
VQILKAFALAKRPRFVVVAAQVAEKISKDSSAAAVSRGNKMNDRH